MEHRCGIRRTLGVGVKLYAQPGLPITGRLLNASSSGGYVATSAKLPIMTRVHVALGWDGLQRNSRYRIAAHVIRLDADGVGLEWQEFAPAPLLALIDLAQTSLSHASPRQAQPRAASENRALKVIIHSDGR